MPRLPCLFAVLLTACFRKDAEKACLGGDADACELMSARYAYGDGVPKDEAKATTFGKMAWDLCAKPATSAVACMRMQARTAVPLDLPAAPAEQTGSVAVLNVIVTADGVIIIDGAPVDDDGLRAKAAALGSEGRAVIKADSSASHGRVIHVLDVLKQAGVAKIAFGVTPVDAGALPTRTTTAIPVPQVRQ
jgi:biopolymer transport protein ExbD